MRTPIVRYGINLCGASERILEALEATRMEYAAKVAKQANRLPDNFHDGTCHRCANTGCRFNTTPEGLLPSKRCLAGKVRIMTCRQSWLIGED